MSTKENANNGAVKPHVQIVEVLRQTAPLAVAELDFVKKKYIDNYNLTHKDKIGELMYHRQLVHFKQSIAGSDKLKAADPFSLYACFLTAAVNGYSLDPADNEIYLIPIGGKAFIWRQAGAHIRRLQQTGQIQFADQVKLVYKGDEFEVVNGRVVKHIEKFTSEEMMAGYIRFVIDEKGNDKFFIYRKTDWEAWKKKSSQQTGENWSGNNGQPIPAFLRTKIVKHACLEKSWAVGITNPRADQFKIEIDDLDEIETAATTTEVTKEEESFHTKQEEEVATAVVIKDEEETF